MDTIPQGEYEYQDIIPVETPVDLSDIPESAPSTSPTPPQQSVPDVASQPVESSPLKRRSTRIRRKLKRLEDYELT